MNTLHIPEREIPVVGEYDVVVVGGGTAGAFAGIAAARAGSKTLIVEQFGSLGGSATAGLVLPLMGVHMKGYDGHCPMSSELVERLRALGAVEDDPNYFDTAILRMVLEDMAVESGCHLMYYTTLVEAVKDGDKITHIIVNNKNGLSAYTAKYFIDATGDADVAKSAGVPYQSGDDNRVNQPVSLRFEMAGVDYDKFHEFMRSLGNHSHKYFAMNTPGMDKVLAKAEEDGVLTKQDIFYFQAFGIPGRPDAMNFNCPELATKENVVDPEFMTQKQVDGKKAILRLRTFLRKYIPGFENAYITELAQLVGFRESRRIEAEYMLTIEDILGYRKFEDGIAASNYPLDIHGVDNSYLNVTYADLPENERFWEVPFRTMVPKTVGNLLVAGRCAGADFRSQSASRVQPTCRSMGEAAGIAAALAVKENVSSFREINGAEVRAAIKLDEKLAARK